MVDRQDALHYRLLGAAAAALIVVATQVSAQQVPGAIPGRCADAPMRPSDVGCYLLASRPIDRLPDEPVFWHIYSYRTRAAAEAARSDSSSAVAESFGKVWLLTIAHVRWRPADGERVAVIGPLPTTHAQRYVARYMEATFPPDEPLKTTVHRHSGAEAWYVVTGAQCLRTPAHTTVLRAGEGGVVPPGPPMVLTAVGRDIRRALVLVLHDASEPWQTNTTEWSPTGECPP
jgi:mannose-6-phosphate isomerase-like protein (cupin superfamily)